MRERVCVRESLCVCERESECGVVEVIMIAAKDGLWQM